MLIYIVTLFGANRFSVEYPTSLPEILKLFILGFTDKDLCQYGMKYCTLYGLGKTMLL